MKSITHTFRPATHPISTHFDSLSHTTLIHRRRRQLRSTRLGFLSAAMRVFAAYIDLDIGRSRQRRQQECAVCAVRLRRIDCARPSTDRRLTVVCTHTHTLRHTRERTRKGFAAMDGGWGRQTCPVHFELAWRVCEPRARVASIVVRVRPLNAGRREWRFSDGRSAYVHSRHLGTDGLGALQIHTQTHVPGECVCMFMCARADGASPMCCVR